MGTVDLGSQAYHPLGHTAMTTYKSGPPRNSLDAHMIVVNKGIPIPPTRAHSSLVLYNAARKLEPGESLDIPYRYVYFVFTLEADTGLKFTVRKIGNVLRIWRTN